MLAMTAKLSGRRYHSGEFEILSQLVLRHESDNPIDSNAVAVYNGDDRLGYLERGLATVVAPLLDRGRPVLVSPIKGKANELNLFVPEPYERISASGNLVRVPSSDGERTYIVDTRRGLCTCPVGRFVRCRHQKALGIAVAAAALPPMSTSIADSFATSA